MRCRHSFALHRMADGNDDVASIWLNAQRECWDAAIRLSIVEVHDMLRIRQGAAGLLPSDYQLQGIPAYDARKW